MVNCCTNPDCRTEFSALPPPGADAIPAFQRVLVATDFSPASRAAFHAALDLCAAFGAKMLLVHVFEYAAMTPPESGGLLLELQSCCERCRDCLDGLAQQAADAGVECETILESGVAASSILDAIAARQIDLAVLGTRALHGFERLVFGSTAEIVLRKSPCPVLTIGPRAAQETQGVRAAGPVVFATDFNFATMQAIRYAARLADLTASPLHCLHVLPRAFEAASQREVIPGIMAEALQQLASESSVTLAPPTCATTFGSEVSYSVVDYAREKAATLIVLGVRQASLLASHVPEHITYRIITEANCPVLTMAYPSHGRAVAAATRHQASQPAMAM